MSADHGCGRRGAGGGGTLGGGRAGATHVFAFDTGMRPMPALIHHHEVGGDGNSDPDDEGLRAMLAATGVAANTIGAAIASLRRRGADVEVNTVLDALNCDALN